MHTETLKLEPDWSYVADSVMGGVSTGAVTRGPFQGRAANRLQGQVSLENNGGFVQLAADINADGSVFDASAWSGVALAVYGNDETYELRLRTDELDRPWQSFRAIFQASDEWTTLRFAFNELESYRTPLPFNPARLCRLGVLAVGREFEADIAVGATCLYR